METARRSMLADDANKEMTGDGAGKAVGCGTAACAGKVCAVGDGDLEDASLEGLLLTESEESESSVLRTDQLSHHS